MADILLREEDLKFASTMVHTLNTILLTSSELFQLRNQLKDLKTPVWAAGAAGGDIMGGGGDLEATWEYVLLLSPCLVGPRIGARAASLFIHPSGAEDGLRGCAQLCPTLAFLPEMGIGLLSPQAAAASLRLPPHRPWDR